MDTGVEWALREHARTGAVYIHCTCHTQHMHDMRTVVCPSMLHATECFVLLQEHGMPSKCMRIHMMCASTQFMNNSLPSAI